MASQRREKPAVKAHSVQYRKRLPTIHKECPAYPLCAKSGPARAGRVADDARCEVPGLWRSNLVPRCRVREARVRLRLGSSRRGKDFTGIQRIH